MTHCLEEGAPRHPSRLEWAKTLLQEERHGQSSEGLTLWTERRETGTGKYPTEVAGLYDPCPEDGCRPSRAQEEMSVSGFCFGVGPSEDDTSFECPTRKEYDDDLVRVRQTKSSKPSWFHSRVVKHAAWMQSR